MSCGGMRAGVGWVQRVEAVYLGPSFTCDLLPGPPPRRGAGRVLGVHANLLAVSRAVDICYGEKFSPNSGLLPAATTLLRSTSGDAYKATQKLSMAPDRTCQCRVVFEYQGRLSYIPFN